ncbi:MAG: hypothetical protein OEW95_02045 [Candidatus Bathyarchaeota archaeon]|nr:hypothetical protein [Candidatus Bathyarchaeota archaeon]
MNSKVGIILPMYCEEANTEKLIHGIESPSARCIIPDMFHIQSWHHAMAMT